MVSQVSIDFGQIYNSHVLYIQKHCFISRLQVIFYTATTHLTIRVILLLP